MTSEDTACAQTTRWNMYTSEVLIIHRITGIRGWMCMHAQVTFRQGCIDNTLLLMMNKKRGGILSSQCIAFFMPMSFIKPAV